MHSQKHVLIVWRPCWRQCEHLLMFLNQKSNFPSVQMQTTSNFSKKKKKNLLQVMQVF